VTSTRVKAVTHFLTYIWVESKW